MARPRSTAIGAKGDALMDALGKALDNVDPEGPDPLQEYNRRRSLVLPATYDVNAYDGSEYTYDEYGGCYDVAGNYWDADGVYYPADGGFGDFTDLDADAIVDDEWDEIEIEYVPPEEGGEGGGSGDEAAPPPNAKPSGKGKGKGKLRRFATLERGTSLKDIADRYSSGGSGGASLPESSAEEDDGEAANEDGTGGPKKRKFATLTRKTTLDDMAASYTSGGVGANGGGAKPKERGRMRSWAKKKDANAAGHRSLPRGASLKQLQENYSVEIVPNVEEDTGPRTWKELATEKGFDFSGMTDDAVYRQQVIFEIIKTEADYCQDLKIIIEDFLDPLRKKGNVMSEDDIDIIFRNVTMLLPVNELLLANLEALRTDDNNVVEEVGEQFTKLASHFATYSEYSRLHPRAIERVLQLNESNRDWIVFQEYVKNIPRVNHLDLGSFLIKPIQRICKYPLLLRDLIKKTPEDHVDYAHLQEALAKVEEVLTEINEAKRLMENAEKIAELASTVDGMSSLSGRLFVREGDMTKYADGGKGQRRHFVLFDDRIMWMKNSRMRTSTYQLRQVIELNTVLVQDLPDTEKIQNAFKLVSAGRKQYVLECDTAIQKQEWLRDLNKYVEMALEVQLAQHQESKASITIDAPSADAEALSQLGNSKGFGSQQLEAAARKRARTAPSQPMGVGLGPGIPARAPAGGVGRPTISGPVAVQHGRRALPPRRGRALPPPGVRGGRGRGRGTFRGRGVPRGGVRGRGVPRGGVRGGTRGAARGRALGPLPPPPGQANAGPPIRGRRPAMQRGGPRGRGGFPPRGRGGMRGKDLTKAMRRRSLPSAPKPVNIARAGPPAVRGRGPPPPVRARGRGRGGSPRGAVRRELPPPIPPHGGTEVAVAKQPSAPRAGGEYVWRRPDLAVAEKRVKINSSGEIKMIVGNSAMGYEALVAAIAEKFAFASANKIASLAFVDDEGDQVRLADDDDVHLLFRFSKCYLVMECR